MSKEKKEEKKFASMEKCINSQHRNLNGPLEKCKEELRDAYMNFKDLQSRCVIEMKPQTSLSEEGHQVYYFKPETFLLDDPEQQRQYREQMLKKVGQVPKPEPITYLGDDLHRSMCQAVADRSQPKQAKAQLCEYFKRRQYSLQHMKYKLLCRWAHHNLTSEQLETMNKEATFLFGKLEFNLEQSIERNERLEQDDYYDTLRPEQRPNTQSESEGSALYVQKFDLAPQSLIREDDIEVYIRGVSHKNKVTRTVTKFMSRFKWLPMRKKYEIFEQAITDHFNMKQQNIGRAQSQHDQVRQRALKFNLMTPELNQDLEQVLEQFYCKKYEKMFTSQLERLQYQWKANHDEAPRLMANNVLLKIRILELAQGLKMNGDIETDQGYPYSYQVQVVFPSYFQVQILKSQFSIYDEGAGESESQSLQARTLGTMARVDTNIFRDLSTMKGQVPSDEAIMSELRYLDIKIIRLKSAAFWIDYVMLSPAEPEWHLKQQAILNCDNPIDTLVKQGFNFLDVNDMATVNRINEDNAHLHIANIQRLAKWNPHDCMKKVKNTQNSDNQGLKHINIDAAPLLNQQNQAAEIDHLLRAVQEDQAEDEQFASQPQKPNHFSQMPNHLLSAFYTLRYLRSRDAKTRLLYTLNYFRCIQKRIALDLREFATRDRIDAHNLNPFVPSKEASQSVVNQASIASKTYDKISQKSTQSEEIAKSDRNMTVFDEQAIKTIKNMASLRQYKCNGLFNNTILSTCPSYPKFHFANGEPTVHQSQGEEMDRELLNKSKSVSQRAIRLMGRIEFIELNEEKQEVYVKDDFGIYIMWDCVLQDMKFLEDELIKIASFYLHKSEVLVDPSSQGDQRPLPGRDRLEIIQDLLLKESEFQFNKVKLVQVYLECYEHITDPLEQQKLMQIMTDVMARRPRLNLNANYFIDGYDAEIMCLKKQFELVKTLVDLQVTIEKVESQRFQDSVNLSYVLANKYSTNRWVYQDAATLIQEIKKTRKIRRSVDKTTDSQKSSQINLGKHSNACLNGGSNQDHLPNQDSDKIGGLNDNLSDDSEAEVGQESEDKFTALLGLPQITLESIYQSYKEKDVNVLKLMQEHSHFITLHEGYPEFLMKLTHSQIMQRQLNFKPNSWSQEAGSLDFYETLDFITKFHAISQSCQQELYDGLKMWDTTLMTHIDYQVASLGLEELRYVIKCQEGALTEYDGRQFVEDEQVMGSADKQVFFVKELLADLNVKPKMYLDPFLIAKLDLQTISFFEFPKLPKEMNKYTCRKNGIAGLNYLLLCEKNAICGAARNKVEKQKTDQGVDDILNGNVTDSLNMRNVVAPPLLNLYCNMMELHRLRNEIILAASETAQLEAVYQAQCESAGLKTQKVHMSEGINFEDLGDSGSGLVNFLDHGPAHQESIGLAIREFDPVLLSNFNFRNPDSFKFNVLTSGLEEVRAILHYQLLQKHLLIVATRINALLIDSSVRALAELSLLEKKKIMIPNAIVRYQKVLNKSFDSINGTTVKMEQSSYKQNLSSNCHPVMYSVHSKKNQQRTTIAKEYQSYQTVVTQQIPHHEYCQMRVMRCFKLKLMTRFVQNLTTEIYLDAQKVQALHSCQRLRMYNRYFQFEPAKLGMNDIAQLVMKYETHEMLENFPSNYAQEQAAGDGDKEIGKKKGVVEVLKFLNLDAHAIIDYSGIPSSHTLMTADSAPVEDMRAFKQKKFEARGRVWGQHRIEKDDLRDVDAKADEPESQLKRLLPTFTPDQNCEKDDNRLLDYEEALYFGESRYAQMVRYYLALDRILQIEWFILKLQFRPDVVITVDSAIENGQLFYKLDEFDQRVMDLIPHTRKDQQINWRAQDYFCDKITALRHKRAVAEQACSLSLTLKSLIEQVTKTKPEQREEYLSSYVEFRYQQVVGSMHKLGQQFYEQKNMQAVRTVHHSIGLITKMNHVQVKFMRPGNYSVQTTVVAPDTYCLEAGNMIHGAVQYDEVLNFRRCVQAIINERALEPAQVNLFQSLYNYDYLRRYFSTQFAGQFCSTANSVPFKQLEMSLLMLSPEERQYSQSFIVQAKYQANDFMETVYNDTSMKSLTTEAVYNLRQLVDAKKFINESTQALLLKNALMCWFENSTLPNSIELYEKFDASFKQNFFWKQMEQKEELTKKLNLMSTFGTIPSQKELKLMCKKIDDLVNDNSLPTLDDVQRRDQLVKALREEFSSLKKKVTLDQYFNTKAEIQVFSNEIEKFLIRASVQALDSECHSLAKCFTLQVPAIQYHIHPFQQFAATMFDQVDPNSHLCISNKIQAIQMLMTRMRNRCTQVETLTSGPGMVLTVKDLNDILIDFCRVVVKENEKQFKSRTETRFLIEQQYKDLLYSKDQKIKTLEHRLDRVGINLENIIDSKLFEKGNQLIYELDSANRVLRLFKKAIYGLEQHLVQRIHGEQLEKFNRKNNELKLKDIKYDKYLETVMNMIQADFAENNDRIKEIIKTKAEFAKNTDRDATSKKTAMYPAASVDGQKNVSGVMAPPGFVHYQHCVCYQPNPKFPAPTLELAELEMLSEAEARRELQRLCILIRKQRIFWHTKDMVTQSKYQDQVNHLKKQLNENQHLWDQQAEAQKREKVLQQELFLTQQSLSVAEKNITKLQNDLKVIDAERQRLLNFKTSKVEKFKELEIKVRKYDLMDTVNTDRLIEMLTKQNLELLQARSQKETYDLQLEQLRSKADKERSGFDRKYHDAQNQTQQVIQKMEQMKLELKMLETNDSSAASIWKKKCLDLFEVCQAIKTENDELRSRCKELIEQGLQLAEAFDSDRPQQQLQASVEQVDSYQQSLMKTTFLGAPSSPSRHQDTKQLYSTHRSSTRGGMSVMTPKMNLLLEPQSFMRTSKGDQAQNMAEQLQQLNLLKPSTQNHARKVPPLEQTPTLGNSTKLTGQKLNDIRSILSDQSKSVSRQQQRHQISTEQPQMNNQAAMALKRRQNYIQQQDSIFNQSQTTTGQQRNITTADPQLMFQKGESIRTHVQRRPQQQLLSFDLQGRSMQQHSKIVGGGRQSSQGAQRTEIVSNSLNLQKVEHFSPDNIQSQEHTIRMFQETAQMLLRLPLENNQEQLTSGEMSSVQ